MKKFILLIGIILVAAACKSRSTIQNADESDLAQLQTLMAGNYSSEKQSKEDAEYYNISLRMVPIWKDRGHFLYVEQAIFDKQDKPYRVRIYKLSKRGTEYISEIYTLKNEADWIGKWKDPSAFDALALDAIELKSGCEVILKRISAQNYAGATGEKTCPSELRGASYASSKVTITPTELISWDQGFDKDGKQVWGATKGGYHFVKY